MMDRSRDADDKVNKASKAAKFVKKGAKGKLLKKRFSATFHRCVRETRETTDRIPTSPRPDARGMDEWADGREWRLTTRNRDAIHTEEIHRQSPFVSRFSRVTVRVVIFRDVAVRPSVSLARTPKNPKRASRAHRKRTCQRSSFALDGTETRG